MQHLERKMFISFGLSTEFRDRIASVFDPHTIRPKYCPTIRPLDILVGFMLPSVPILTATTRSLLTILVS
jgi:hypothetical protein